MLKHGARLPSLESRQKWERKRNNDSSGKNYPDTEEGLIHMATKQEVSSTEKSESVTPAGGESDSAVVSDFVKALHSNRAEIGRVLGKSRAYTRIALEAAIPTTIYVVGVVTTVGVLVAIDNKWGNGARANKLIERGVFDNVRLQNQDGALIATPSAG
jgi:hypothetical protein